MLNYGNTCGIIDYGIDSFEDNCREEIKDLLQDIFPYLDNEEVEHVLEDKVKKICSYFEEYAEVVRDTNIEMREAADEQIEDLEIRVSELEDNVNDLEDEIDEKDSSIEKLENQNQLEL